ncbi:MAG: 23S rRNA (pseudouridine(1915)-N(3))-methyltransferase RlmH [Endozoicomonadaceae bacterium]|nr:23S rRNA (pseudouridine(1915)-N(3))-methyltransferase RlmH [Endozoicomonadaceae bacterium]
MRIRLIAVGQKMPSWVVEGYNEYARRLPANFSLELHEISLGKRTRGADIARMQRNEGAQMLSAIDPRDKVIAMEVNGKSCSSETLADQLGGWHDLGENVSLLVGGVEGMLPEVSARADLRWSLSSLTLPHPMVRILIAEQLYRAWSILNNHPYHR